MVWKLYYRTISAGQNLFFQKKMIKKSNHREQDYRSRKVEKSRPPDKGNLRIKARRFADLRSLSIELGDFAPIGVLDSWSDGFN
jgi:hypothetical protein